MRNKQSSILIPATLACAGIITLFAILMFLLTKYPFALDDGLRHITFAKTIFTDGTHGWSEYFFSGYHSAHDFDPWFLSHVLYIPFSIIPNLAIGLKLFSLFGMLLLACTFLFCIKRTIRSNRIIILLITLLFFGSSMFTGRLLLGRPYVISLCGLFLAYHAIIHRRFIILFLLTVLATLISHLFVFYILISCAGSMWFIFLKRDLFKLRMLWAFYTIIAVCGGSALGIWLHPQSVEYVAYLVNVFAKIPFSKNLHIGSELTSMIELTGVIVISAIGSAVLLMMVFIHKHGWRKLSEDHSEILLSCIITFAFLCAYFLWMRAIDYLWPFVLLFITQLLGANKDAYALADRILRDRIPRIGLSWLTVCIGLCVINIVPTFLYLINNDELNNQTRYSAIESLPSGSRVLNVDWGVFPVLYSLRTDLIYARGMDPSFDYYHNPEDFMLFDKKQDVEDVSLWLQDMDMHFDADYIALQKNRNKKLIDKILEVSEVVGESEDMIVFEI